MADPATLVIGTRGSPLALAQAHETQDRLAAALGWSVEQIPLSIIKTTGDAIQDRPLSEAGGKGLFTKELDSALMMSGIDLAVHSAKDLPTFLPAAIEVAGYLPREDVRDVWISPVAPSPRELPRGAVVGTGSIIAAGAIVTQNTVVPPGSIYAGNPAKLLKAVSPEAAEVFDRTANNYVMYAGWFNRGLNG